MQLIRVACAIYVTCVLSGCGQTEPVAPSVAASQQDGAAQGAELTARDWSLDPAASRVSFVSIKAGELIETHYFSGLSGEVEAGGEASVMIPLDQVETRVDIRNERMREMFFETARFPAATIRTTIDPQAFADLPVGGRTMTSVDATLSLHGVNAAIAADAFVTRIAADRVEVASAEPVVVTLADYGLEAGLEALREVAGLPSITAASPVTFSFVFEARPM